MNQNNVARKNATPKERRLTQVDLDALIELLPPSVAKDQRGPEWESRWYDLIVAAIASHRRLTGDYKGAYAAKNNHLKGVAAK
jgi:hypothetical protein